MLNDYPVYATIATGDVAQARAFHEVVPRFGYADVGHDGPRSFIGAAGSSSWARQASDGGPRC
jgi:hypothetical protein